MSRAPDPGGTSKTWALEMRKRARQIRFGWMYPYGGSHLVIDAYQAAVARHRIGNRECVTKRRDIRINKTSPNNDWTCCAAPPSENVIGDEPGALIAKAYRWCPLSGHLAVAALKGA